MIKNRFGKYKVLKWIAGIFGVLVLILAVAAIYLSAQWKPMLTEKIKEGVVNGSNGLYVVDFQDIHLNLLTGSAALDSVSLLPVTSVYNELKKQKLAPVHLFQVKLAKLRLNRIDIISAYFNKKVEMNSIVLDQPSINIIHNKVSKNTDTLKDNRSLYQQIAKTLKSIHVKSIKIIDADLDYINGANGKSLNSVKHLNVNVRDLLIDSLAQSDTTRFFYTKDLSFDLSGYKSTGKDKMYTMKVDTVRGSVARGTISVRGFQMIPLHPDLTFTRKYAYGKDRYDLNFDEISFAGVDFIELYNNGHFYARTVTIGSAKAGIFVNRELPPPPGFDKVRNFPHMALKRLTVPIIIDKVELEDIDVAYTEYNPISQKRGTIYFQHLTGSITNLSNDSSRLAQNSHAIANLHAKVMKVSRIDVRIDFNLTDKLAAFNYSGKVGPMDMTVLNPMAKDMGLVEIESGRMQSASFDIKANAFGSSGRVHFNYTDLKVKLLKEGEEGNPTKEKGLLSFLANALLIRNDNPSKGEAPRVANITFQRTPAASFFNLLWKSFFIGMRDIVGIGLVPVKTPEQALEKVKDKKEERRERRTERKAERKKEAERDAKKEKN